jgi:sortase (surface protein transpeptidase)
MKHPFASAYKRNRDLTPRRKVILLAVSVFLVAALAAGGWYLTSRPADRGTPHAKRQGDVVTRSTDKPDEKPVSKDYAWKGGDRDPKFIELPSIASSGFVQQMGVDQNKQIAVPTNIHLAGWFVDSVRPGRKGLSIIVGHVNGVQSDAGIFKQLGKLKAEEEFKLTLGNGDKLTYKVMDVKSYKTAESANYLFSQSPGIESQLNLVTCSGSYDKAARSYDQRTIVTAKLL